MLDWNAFINMMVDDQQRNTFIQNLIAPYSRVEILSQRKRQPATATYSRVKDCAQLNCDILVLLTPFNRTLSAVREGLILDLVDCDMCSNVSWKKRERQYIQNNIHIVN